jgi:hypothetical protein
MCWMFRLNVHCCRVSRRRFPSGLNRARDLPTTSCGPRTVVGNDDGIKTYATLVAFANRVTGPVLIVVKLGTL